MRFLAAIPRALVRGSIVIVGVTALFLAMLSRAQSDPIYCYAGATPGQRVCGQSNLGRPVRVVNLHTHAAAECRVNDALQNIKLRCLSLSDDVAKALGTVLHGASEVVPVQIDPLETMALETGIASIYGLGNGSGDSPTQALACSRGRLNINALTAAHKTLPCGAKVRVTNLGNGRSVVVTINDRGPFIRGRVIDLTPASAAAIGLSRQQGLARVSVERCAGVGGSSLVQHRC